MFNSFDIVEGSGSSSLCGRQMIKSNVNAKESTEQPIAGATSEVTAAMESTPVCTNGVCVITWKPRRP